MSAQHTLPNGWEDRKIGNFLERVRMPVDVEPDTEYNEIGVRSHGKGIFYKPTTTGAKIGNKSVFWIQPDCLILNIVFAWEQAVARTTDNEVGMIASHRFPMYIPGEEAELDYLLYFFKSKIGKHFLELASPGGAGRNKTLGQTEFATISIPLPPPNEQKKIAETLSIWDKAITLTEKLLVEKELRRKGLIQQLLSGKERLPGFDGEWERHTLGDFMTESRIPGTDGKSAKKLSIQLHGRGLRQKNEKRQGSSATKYYSRKKGQFIYSKLDFLNGAFGIVPDALDGFESTLDLPAFDVSSSLNTQWFIYFLTRKEYYSQQLGIANGGRKARRVNPKDFMKSKMNFPSKEEQDAIVRVLTVVDREINLLKDQLTALREQKKGLMQQLLTGKLRVKA